MGYDVKAEREAKERLAQRAAVRKMRVAKIKNIFYQGIDVKNNIKVSLLNFVNDLTKKLNHFLQHCNAQRLKIYQNQIKHEELKRREAELFKQEEDIKRKRRQLEEEIRRVKEKQKQTDQRNYPQTLQEAFEVLGTSSGLTLEKYKKIWKQEVMKYHPDRAAGLGERLQKKAEEEMKIINKAWEIIKKRCS